MAKTKIAPKRKMTRKETRKAERKMKKMRKMAFASKKPLDQIIPSAPEPNPKPKKSERKSQAVDKRTTGLTASRKDELVVEGPTNHQMERSRRKRQHELLKEEEMELKRLSKKLGYNKRKAKTLPNVFTAEGLDYVLNVCDAGKRAEMLPSDDEASDSSEQSGDDDVPKRPKQKNGQKNQNSSDSESQSDTDAKEKESDDNGEEAVVKEDIYGRSVDSRGQLIDRNPAAARQKLLELEENLDSGNIETREALRKKINGIINRVSEGTLQASVTQLSDLFNGQSRNDFKQLFSDSLYRSCAVPFRLPDRLVMEYSLLVALLHCTLSAELSGFFVESLACQLRDGRQDTNRSVDDRALDNICIVFAHLCNFQVIKGNLILDLLKLFLESFTDKDTELLLLLLTQCGFSLRKTEPLALKEFIHSVHLRIGQEQAQHEHGSKVQFMFETLLALKNNNVLKMANYDPSLLEHYQKLFRALRKVKESALPVGLQDLFDAKEKGRWWVVGSAWRPDESPVEKVASKSVDLSQFDGRLLALAKKARMNTELRRAVFCVLVSAEDCVDAFEKLMRLGLKDQQEREIVHICVTCCMKERQFNPYYSLVLHKLCTFHARFQLTTQYALWDRMRDLSKLSVVQRKSLSSLLTHLLKNQTIGLSVLKCVDFAELDSPTCKCLKRMLGALLSECSTEEIQEIFGKVLGNAKLKLLADGLQIFIHNIVKKDSQDTSTLTEEQLLINERIEFLDSIWFSVDIS